jgi:hypothetical protein
VDHRLIELLQLLETLFWGRVALSLLPPGRIGSHRPEGLAATAAASFLLGSILAVAIDLPAVLLGLPSIPARALTWLAASVALVRWLTLPAAFVPSLFASVDPARPGAIAHHNANDINTRVILQGANNPVDMVTDWAAKPSTLSPGTPPRRGAVGGPSCQWGKKWLRTRSPTAKPSTPSPTAVTMPAPSDIGMRPSSVGISPTTTA